MYTIYSKSENSQARNGVLKTRHGQIETPFFMPIATKAAVKTLTSDDLQSLGAQIVLSNTYHLYLRPGLEVLKKNSGLHKLMNWNKPILTDSGGFQVFSLSGTKIRKGNLVKIKDNGVEFSSHIDGSKHFFDAKKVLEIQKIIGSDIAMILDVCTKNPATREQAEKDMELTLRWAKEAWDHRNKQQLTFAIVQGSTFKNLRIKCAQELVKHNWDGFAVGGLAVGESEKVMYDVLDYTVPELPVEKPRYLMGVGKPENIVNAVKRGIDMFDCVIPTREARHGRLFIRIGNDLNKDFYKVINITNSKFKNDLSPIHKTLFPDYSRAYLFHLFSTEESLGQRLATIINLDFYLNLMKDIRSGIKTGKI